MRPRSLAVIASFAALLTAAPAYAGPTTYTWSPASGGTVNDSSITFGANESGNEKAKATAYQISSLSAGSSFATATLARYPGGLGLTISNEAAQPPTRALDNRTGSTNGRYELLLVQFDNANYRNMGFQIGWSQSDSDMQVWVGDAAAGLSLSGSNGACGRSCDFTELGLLGLGRAPTFQNAALGTAQTVGGALTGRYLLTVSR
jgi:hypothetical protein